MHMSFGMFRIYACFLHVQFVAYRGLNAKGVNAGHPSYPRVAPHATQALTCVGFGHTPIQIEVSKGFMKLTSLKEMSQPSP